MIERGERRVYYFLIAFVAVLVSVVVTLLAYPTILETFR